MLSHDLAHVLESLADLAPFYSVFREPVVVESKAKTDPSASARSTIRRSRSVRYPRGRDDFPSAYRLHPTDDADRPSARHNLIAVAARREASRRSASSDIVEADNARREASDRRRMENGRALLRDALSYERPDRLTRDPIGLSSNYNPANASATSRPPITRHYRPTSPDLDEGYGDAWERFEDENARIEAMRGRFAPTPPPYTPSDRPGRPATAQGVRNARVGFASYTPRFAPAYRFGEPSPDPNRPPSSQSVPTPPSLPESLIDLRTSTSPVDVNVNELPPLRRMGRRSIYEARAVAGRSRPRSHAALAAAPATVDGLGDRQRSMTPDDGWDTMVATVAPDHRLPSASSSFTSATASASAGSRDSNSNTNSTSTSLTAPSDTEYPPICDDLLLSSSDSEGSDIVTPADDVELGSFDMNHEMGVFERVLTADRDARRQMRSGRSGQELAGTGEELADEEHNLQDMQQILNGLARREDIPDDWWAAAGLTRNLSALSARVDRIERERL